MTNSVMMGFLTMFVGIIGAFQIADAVKDFKKGKYFLFGVDTVLAIAFCVIMVGTMIMQLFGI